MAGPELFYNYETMGTEHQTFTWFATQTDADAGAVSAGRLSNVGSVEIPNGWETGWIRNPVDGAWRLLAAADLDESGQRIYAATALYAALDGFMGGLSRIIAPSKDVARVSDLIAHQRWCAYVVFELGAWTPAQQIAWAKAAMSGPTDGETTQALVRAAHGLTAAQVPGGAFTWADPATAVRGVLSASEAGSVRWLTGLERDLTMTDLDGWIDNLS